MDRYIREKVTNWNIPQKRRLMDQEEKEEDEPEMYRKHYDPRHPYCTNWPVGHQGKFKEDNESKE